MNPAVSSLNEINTQITNFYKRRKDAVDAVRVNAIARCDALLNNLEREADRRASRLYVNNQGEENGGVNNQGGVDGVANNQGGAGGEVNGQNGGDGI